MSLQMDRSSSTTRTFGFVLIQLIRDPQREYRSLPYFTLQHDISAMLVRNFLHESQSQTETALLAGFRIGAAVKLFKYLRSFVSRNSAALICNLAPDGAIPIRNTDRHRRARGTV